MSTATKSPGRKQAVAGSERALHAVFGALEVAGTHLTKFAKKADSRLTAYAKKHPRKATKAS